MFEQTISFDRMEHAVSLFGNFDGNIRLIESEFDVKIISRGSDVKVMGEPDNVASAVTALKGHHLVLFIHVKRARGGRGQDIAILR